MEASEIWILEKRYYKKVIDLQDATIAAHRARILEMDSGAKLNDATPREWDLATALLVAQKSNKILQELCDDLRNVARKVGQGEIVEFFKKKDN